MSEQPPPSAPRGEQHDYRSLDFSEFDAAQLVTVARMRITEADLAKAKLQAEGIPCLIRDARMAITHPFVVSDVPLLVREGDRARAREILSQPADDSVEGEYVEEDYRCPKCHRRDVELLPLSPGWRRLRKLWIILLVAPIALAIFERLAGYSPGPRASHVIEAVLLGWILVVLVLGVVVLLAKRGKECKSCHHRWSRGAS